MRWSAVDAAYATGWPELEPAIDAATAQHADLAPFAKQWKQHRAAERAEAVKEAAALARGKAREQLAALAAAGQWPELLAAATAHVVDRPLQAEGWRQRGVALARLGRAAEALACAAVVKSLDTDTLQAGIDYDVAREQLAKLVDRNGDRDAMVTLLVEIRTRTRMRDEAFADAVSSVNQALADSWPALRFSAALERGRGADELRALTETLPELPEVWFAFGDWLAKKQPHFDEAARALRRALELVRSPATLSAEATRARRLVEVRQPAPTASAVLARLITMLVEAKRLQDVVAACDEALAIDRDHVVASKYRATSLTFLMRHEEAIVAYGEALAIMERVLGKVEHASDPRGLMHFNRGCELARLGRREPALADLRAAVAYDRSWGDNARTDDYFASLWEDREFLLAAAGRTSVAKDEVAALVQACQGHVFNEEYDEAIAAGEHAIAAAEILEDPRQLVDALGALGWAQSRAGKNDAALPTLERALTLAEAAPLDDSTAVADARNSFAVALHAAGRLEEAEAHYRRAFDERAAKLGAHHPRLARSFGDLALLAESRGQPAEAVATNERGRVLLRDFLATNPPRDERQAALYDLATLSAHLAELRLADDTAASLAALAAATDALEDFAREGRPAPQLVRLALRTAVRLGELLTDEAARAQSVSLWNRLYVVLEPSETVREQLQWWAAVRIAVSKLIVGGVPEQLLASGFVAATRGGALPDEMRDQPAFANLGLQLARRLAGGGDLVTMAIAFTTAAAVGGLGETLVNLQEISVARTREADQS